MEKSSSLREALVRCWPALVAFAIFAFVVWLWLAPLSPALGPTASILIFSTRVAAAFTTLAYANSTDPSEGRRSWRYFGVSLTLWASADALQVVSWVLTSAPLHLPSAGDFLNFAGYLAALAALGTYPASPPERFGRFRDLLDQIILGLAVFALTWLILIQPVLDVGMGKPIQIFWASVSPIFDMVLLVFILRITLLEPHPTQRTALRLLGLAVVALMVGDLGDGYRILQAERISTGLVEVCWMVSSALFIPISGNFTLPKISSKKGLFRTANRLVSARLEPLLPIAFTYAVVGFTVIDWWLSGEVNWIGIAAAGILSLMLVARQGIIVGQFEMRQFAALVNASADIAFICQADGQVWFANPALHRVLGSAVEGDKTINLMDLVIVDGGVDAILVQALEDGWTGEAMFKRDDGTTFPVLLSLMPVDDVRQTRAMIAATAHDLTFIREREVALRKALDEVAEARNELEDLNIALEEKVEARTSELEAAVAELGTLLEEVTVLDRMKTEFVALVSHELRAPLTNIRSGVELILNSDAELTTSVRESLTLVEAETRRLAQFVGTILDLSALEAGRFPLQPHPVQVEIIAQEVCTRFLEDHGGNRLKLDLPQGLPDVMADEQVLESVFFHLLDNALKYAPEGEIWVKGWVENANVYIAVSDSGPGIPPEERERVFELFHRVDASDSREVYGYGLGLPMVQRLLEAMEGGIRIEQDPSGGARLVFWLRQANDNLSADLNVVDK